MKEVLCYGCEYKYVAMCKITNYFTCIGIFKMHLGTKLNENMATDAIITKLSWGYMTLCVKKRMSACKHM